MHCSVDKYIAVFVNTSIYCMHCSIYKYIDFDPNGTPYIHVYIYICMYVCMNVFRLFV